MPGNATAKAQHASAVSLPHIAHILSSQTNPFLSAPPLPRLHGHGPPHHRPARSPLSPTPLKRQQPHQTPPCHARSRKALLRRLPLLPRLRLPPHLLPRVDAPARRHDDRGQTVHPLRGSRRRRLGHQSRAGPGAPGHLPRGAVLPLPEPDHLR